MNDEQIQEFRPNLEGKILKPGSRVICNGIMRTIYSVYSDTEVSLCLIGYRDVECDSVINISELK